MKNNYRILIVSGYDFSGTDATSITLRNIFSYMPKEDIAFIKTGNYHELSDYKYINIHPSFAGKLSSNYTVKKISSHKGQVAGLAGTNSKVGIKAKILNNIHTIGSSYRMLIPYRITKEINSFVENFKPTFIYSLLANDAIMHLCLKLSNKHNIPIIPHFMDDWQGVMFAHNPILYPARIRLIRNLKKVLAKSPFALTIGEKMANEYSKRYNSMFIPLMNCLDSESNIEERTFDKDIRIVFSGGLHLKRSDSIVMLCRILSNLRGYNFILEVYTSEDNWNRYSHQFSNFDFVRYGGFVTPEEILVKNKEADILLHVESFDEKIKKYTRLSVSTKIPEYLASKRLIIAIGPSDIASIEYLKDNNAAVVLDNDIEENIKKLNTVINDHNVAKEIINNAYNTYKSKHIKSKLHKNINDLFNSISAK